MKLVLDAGALIALDRNDRAMWRRLKAAHLAGVLAVTHGGVVGQAWRGGGVRQASLARALAALEVRALDERLGREAGKLLARAGRSDVARAGRSDVVDAALVLLADDDDQIVTSDAGDLAPLAQAAGRHLELLPV